MPALYRRLGRRRTARLTAPYPLPGKCLAVRSRELYRWPGLSWVLPRWATGSWWLPQLAVLPRSHRLRLMWKRGQTGNLPGCLSPLRRVF